MGRNPYLAEPVKTIVPSRKTVSELLEAMADTAFQGRALGEAYMFIRKMIREPKNTIFLGLAGSLSTAGMCRLVKRLVENRYIDVLVSTGANISEDTLEAMGYKYYKGSPLVSNEYLLNHKIDRFYDLCFGARIPGDGVTDQGLHRIPARRCLLLDSRVPLLVR